MPVDRRVEVEVPIPYDREVPVDRWYKDDREINRLKDENSQLMKELQEVRDRLRREIEQNSNSKNDEN